MTEFLRTAGLTVHYRTPGGIIRAVDGVSFEISQPGQALALIGESGCGKSSAGLALLRLLPGNTSEFSGSIRFEGCDLTTLNNEDFRRSYRWKKIAWVPQNTKSSLDPYFSIEAQFKELFEAHGIRNAAEKISRLLATVGLSKEKCGSIPDRLSGGEIQRACIALAFALEPALVILDEPTSALDPSLKGQIISLLISLKKELSTSYLFITHDIAQAAAVCDYFIVLYAGKIVEKGTREQILKTPLHPYTRKLLECISLSHQGEGVAYIPGEPPDLKGSNSGCSFAPRCDQSEAACLKGVPVLDETEEGHFVACRLARKI
ncbi:ABC transporter ATP-binding protein [Dehalogenimonas alkenigignens]|uniref:ABC transporter ATP-binding protein n=1 Tax=Dehalogenimonas alkenigignens TaxID=1217799 RepID=UPI0007EFA8D9|nr:ABC transporter ATP-binding protein [Dehalogenimonas alkenigignens]